MKTEYRYRVEWKPLTFWQRVAIWWRNVKFALLEKPDAEYANYVEVKPGDLGYWEAPFASTITFTSDREPARYEFKDGQYVPVPMAPALTQPNPSWTTPNNA